MSNRMLRSDRLFTPAISRAHKNWVGADFKVPPENDGWTEHFTTDQFVTFDQATQLTIDSTGSFLVGELERLDQNLHEPLVAVTWGRDIDLREDVTMADEVSSYTLSSFAAPGGITPTGKNWIGKDSNAISGIQLDIGKVTNPLIPWGTELKWTLLELESASRVGRPIDTQKYAGMKMKYQMDIDEMVYTGDTTFGKHGMFNSTLVTPANAAANGTGSPNTAWVSTSGALTKSPDNILADVNALLTSTWIASGTAMVPTELRLPPLHFSTLASQKVSDAGNVSIIEFLRNNSLTNASYGRPLNIQPVKWLTGLGGSGTNRMVAYTKDKERIRYPLVPMQHTPVEYRSIYQLTTYYARLGCVELVYPETVGYTDGI
jgi:hypothetical protein